jgi:hypothetical protein
MRPKSASSALSHHGRPAGIDNLTDSARRGELVAIIGTGVSISLTNNKIPALSWKGLILDGFAHGVKKGKISSAQSEAWKAQLDSKDLDDLLGAAEFMGRKLDAPRGDLYARWLENVFKHVKPANKEMEDALRELHATGIPLCTLNYDSLLESVTTLPALNLAETARVGAWMRRESQGILHLHGSWDAPASCILGIRDYETTLADDVRDLIQRSLGSFRRLLFIGCGDTFADPNFSALIGWLKRKMKTAAPEHYALVKEDEVATRHADPTWQGFVEPLGYGGSHSQLAGFLLKHFRTGTPTVARKKNSPAKAVVPSSGHARFLQDYRTFLLKDCGQMTIEGVRADMDTAQRRFDLERLFVPLKVLPSPPEIPEADPHRERILLEWQEKNKSPLPFGKVFAKHRRVALLALPGGGKTLLLKRLAVAYADTARRQASSDALPNLDLTPVLIRCREWREHIHRPIATILQNIPDITGQASLVGLSDALIPLFKKGRILLLVDGLDEIHDDALRTTFVEHLEAFLGDHMLTRLVVTSREAGFSLVAPSLARFCERWRVAPLEPDAVAALCDHWHRLMTGDSPEAQAEGRQVANLLLKNEALRRLAENPLLLTMLLVVKRGAGRLPPDRVSLYGRAVEVLLDTWNIKGHDPLNAKEAVPQLAYVAFELMRAGKQTATEKELLILLEEARDKVPQIRRYSRDTPQEFLKRVELRSSLLVEVGRQAEGSSTVPFYQFRHLTFQEYLAAVAAVEGHYLEYDKSDTVLVPLESHLTDEKWKEVIPMSAVLARKQAEPLIVELVAKGNILRQRLEANEDFPGKAEWSTHPGKLPAPIARLAQCLVEEAEAAPETLTATLQLVALFARGCQAEHDWRALSRGPYGEELWHQAWLLYAPMQWPSEAWLRNTCAALAAHRLPDPYSDNNGVLPELKRLLASQSEEDIGRGLLACSGLFWNRDDERPVAVNELVLDEVTRYIFHAHPALQNAAIWGWTNISRSKQSRPHPTPAILDQLLLKMLGAPEDPTEVASYALSLQLGLSRSAWTPVLTEEQVLQLRQTGEKVSDEPHYRLAAACVVAFHSGKVWSEEELATRLVAVSRGGFAGGVRRHAIAATLEQMGATGRKHLKEYLKKEKS